MRIAGLILALLGAALAAARADPPVNIRQGRHGDTGRLVFDFPAPEEWRSQLDGNVVALRFAPALPIGSLDPRIPGVAAVQGGVGVARLQLAAGAAMHVFRLGNRVVVDVTPPRLQRADTAAPLRAGPSLAALVERRPPVPPKAMAPATVTLPAPATAPPAAIAPPAAPAAVAANPGASPPEVIDFANQPGAAAFRRGGLAVLVFDTSEVPDLTGLQSAPLFADASLNSLQDAQVITFPLPAADALAVSPVAGGWQVQAVPAAQPIPAPPQGAGSAVEFPMQSANESIIVADPLAGGDLLIGTVTQAGDAADFTASGPGYAVLPAWLGVAVLPLADDLGLNASLKGFELVSDAPNGLPLGAAPPPAAASASVALGQTLSLPHGSVVDLYQRMLADQRQAAILPPLGRLQAQITLAQDLLALGFGPETRGVLDTALQENPAAQDNGQIAEMRAIADVLAHRSQPADFAAAGIVPSPELSFWQELAALDADRTVQPIPGLLSGLPLFETYPEPLRDAVAPEIAEALAASGRPQAARQLLGTEPKNPALDLARARLLEAQGQTGPALAAYQALVNGQDLRLAALAEARVVELQLAAGRLNDAQAADALDAQLFDWRTPTHERHLRLRIAALRADSGQWPKAFTGLQAARRLFPGHRAEIDALRSAMFLRMLKGDGLTRLSPIDAVAVLQQNQDLIPAGGAGTPVIELLARRLEALDLPGAAAPMLNHLIETIPPGAPRAGIGATLAQVDLDAGSPVAALADLAGTQADDLPPALAARRAMLAAKAQAQTGNAVAAVQTLATGAAAAPAMPSATGGPAIDPQALDAQAQIAEQSGQWKQAEQALAALAGQSIPAAGPLDAGQEDLLLRLATAASHNNDGATLARLFAQYAGRVGSDPPGQMFQTLTAPPLTSDQGLNQALHDIAQLQALPEMVNAVAGGPAAGAPAAGAPAAGGLAQKARP